MTFQREPLSGPVLLGTTIRVDFLVLLTAILEGEIFVKKKGFVCIFMIFQRVA